MAEDAIYWDVTMEPAHGLDGITEFGEGWLEFCPDFGCFVESLITQGDTVVSMGWITGHPNPGVEWFPGHDFQSRAATWSSPTARWQ